MKKTVIIIMFITIISKFFGFFREIVLSYFYGASNITDAYLISMTIPSFMFMFIGTAIVNSYIPLYTKLHKDGSDEDGDYLTSNLINIILVLLTIVVIIILFTTDQIVRIFASGFDEQTVKLAASFTKVSVLTLHLSLLIYIFKGYLQIKNNFLAPAIIGIPLNIIVIISIIFSHEVNSTMVLPIGYTIAILSQLILMLPWIRSNGYKHKYILDFQDVNTKKFLAMSVPIIIGVSVNEINVLVDRTLASRIAIGGISALTYAKQLNLFVQGIFVVSVITVMYPMISKMIASNNLVGTKKVVGQTIVSVSLFLMPATLGYMIFSKSIVTMLYGRGAFNHEAIELTSISLFYYSAGIVAIGLREVVSRVFYSLNDTKTPMVNSALGMLLNIILNIVLSRYLGIGGLALATSIAAIFTTALLFISLRKKIGPFGMKQISISFLKILFASLVMGGLAKLSFNYLTASLSQNLSLLMAIGVGAVSYFVIIYFMKIEDVDVIVGAIKKKFGRGAA